MFTGIVQKLVEVSAADHGADLTRLTLNLDDLATGLELGASVAVNGACLTVTSLQGDIATFDVIAETVRTTTLGGLKRGDRVNVERSFKVGDEIGGHLVSGHVTGVARVSDIAREGAAQQDVVMTFVVDPCWMKYVFHKGFIAIDGASLTISSVDKSEHSFQISLIPETLARTTLGRLTAGACVNFEIEAQTLTTVETVERVMAEQRAG